MVRESTSDEALSRYQKIQELAERRAERRRKRLRLYWWLLALVLMLAVLTLFTRRPGDTPDSEDLAEDVAETVAARLPDDPAFQQRVSEQVQAQMPEPRSYPPILVSALEADPVLAGRLRGIVGPKPEQWTQVYQQALGAHPADVGRRLAGVQAQVERLEEVEQRAAAGDRRLDEMAARLDELAGEVERLRDLALPSLSYVVKAGAQTRIPELGLSLEVGKLENGSLAGVRVFETAGGRQLYPSDGAAPVALGLGVPFVVDDAGRRFRLTFGYSVNRWVARDLVGLEVRRLPR